jgi:TonB family protein
MRFALAILTLALALPISAQAQQVTKQNSMPDQAGSAGRVNNPNGPYEPDHRGPAPLYPLEARVARTEGKVMLNVTTDERGAVTTIDVAQETPEGQGFGEAAVKAVRQWVFLLPDLQGKSFVYPMGFRPPK